MADRIHPRVSSPSSGEAPSTTFGNGFPSHSVQEKPVQYPGTYVIQIPKDQIYRYPPPENAHRYQKKSRSKPRRGCCCRFLCWTLCLLALLIFLFAFAVGVLYLVFRPESPRYSLDDIAVRGFNLTSPSAIWPEFNVTVRAQNPNDKIGIYYGTGSSVIVYYSDVNLSNGAFPSFYQPSNNITVLQAALKGSKMLLAGATDSVLVTEQKQGKVPLSINLEVPVKLKVGAVKTWTITVTVKCEVAVNSLTTSSKIVSQKCKKSVELW